MWSACSGARLFNGCVDIKVVWIALGDRSQPNSMHQLHTPSARLELQLRCQACKTQPGPPPPTQHVPAAVGLHHHTQHDPPRTKPALSVFVPMPSLAAVPHGIASYSEQHVSSRRPSRQHRALQQHRRPSSDGSTRCSTEAGSGSSLPTVQAPGTAGAMCQRVALRASWSGTLRMQDSSSAGNAHAGVQHR